MEATHANTKQSAGITKFKPKIGRKRIRAISRLETWLRNHEKNAIEMHEKLTRRGVKKAIPNRGPSLHLDAAALFQSASGEFRAASLHRITLAECLGHYPIFPMAYLSVLGEVMGQTGALLLRLNARHDNYAIGLTPLAVAVGDMAFVSKRPLRPGTQVITIAHTKQVDAQAKRSRTMYSADIGLEMFDFSGREVMRSNSIQYIYAPIPTISGIISKTLGAGLSRVFKG